MIRWFIEDATSLICIGLFVLMIAVYAMAIGGARTGDRVAHESSIHTVDRAK